MDVPFHAKLNEGATPKHFERRKNQTVARLLNLKNVADRTVSSVKNT